MGRFFFKKFAVTQERSAMKVNTDGVLLGAWCCLPSAGVRDESFKVLDVGTGTGVIALMVAQRLASSGVKAEITGIDRILRLLQRPGIISESLHGERI